jgi:hypothetical protein
MSMLKRACIDFSGVWLSTWSPKRPRSIPRQNRFRYAQVCLCVMIHMLANMILQAIGF